MKIVGVIAEYDPFHSGHALQLSRLREQGAEKIVVCMSCDLVQRGGFAILPPRVRVQAALTCGADLVLALPNPWACASAESFGAAGVALLSALGCVDTLAFGAETPDVDALMAAAALLDSPEFSTLLRRELADGAGFAPARASAARQISPALGELLNTPNNLLGVEYCKAIRRQGSDLKPLALLREGAGHHAALPQQASAITTASGSAIRRLWQSEGLAAAVPCLPAPAAVLYREAEAAGLRLDMHSMDVALLSRLRGMSRAQMAHTRGVGEGLENRLADVVARAATLEQLYAALKTRRYAHARLRRLVMDAALGYDGTLPALPPFLWVLGAKRESLSLCANATLPCGTSLAALERQNGCAVAAKAHVAAADLSALCRQTPQPMGLAYTQKPVLL